MPDWRGAHLLTDDPRHARGRVVTLYAVLALGNLAAWGWALIAFRHHPLALGTALLAYGLGLRHAVDADHLAAIDNVTRKLMQEGKRPVAVGFYFSLGHSTVVALACLAVALTAATVRTRFPGLREVGTTIGTLVSAVFLLAVAAMNGAILVATYRAFDRVRRGGGYLEEDLNALLAGGGPLTRVFRSLFRTVRASWYMYPLGFLFGLGFDTATEVGLLGLSAVQASGGMGIWSILVFPALFTAAMSLVDTTDGVLMVGAYGWAFTRPVRKLYYNLTITVASVIVALVIGGVEALGLVRSRFELEGAFWDRVDVLSGNLGNIGYLVVGVFVAIWLVSMVVYRIGRYDELECTPAA